MITIDDQTKALFYSEIPKMEGWLSADRAVRMYELIMVLRPMVVVEIGVFGGRSMLAQALAVKKNGQGRFYGIDPWKVSDALEGEEDTPNAEWWRKNVNLERMHQLTMECLWKHELDPWAVIIRAASQNCSELFNSIDILNVDGNHSEVASVRDLTLYLPKVKKNGYIWMDDCDWPTTKKAVELLDSKCCLIEDRGHYRLYCNRNPKEYIQVTHA